VTLDRRRSPAGCGAVAELLLAASAGADDEPIPVQKAWHLPTIIDEGPSFAPSGRDLAARPR
jgi:hypothetical protein